MELMNEFRVDVPVQDAWNVLTDVERIAPMLPGAQLQEIEGDEYRGVVKVKVGPITAQYKGKATFVDRDEAAGRVVLDASGRDTRGQGNASARITATMEPDGDGTRVKVVTDLTITGKVAQFGRGVLAEVSAKLLGQFVDALHEDIAAGGASDAGAAQAGTAPATTEEPAWTAAPVTAAGDGAVRRIESREADPVDLIAVAGGSAIRRILPVAGVLAVIAFILARRRAHRLARLARLTDVLPGR